MLIAYLAKKLPFARAGPCRREARTMLVQIYETQDASEARALEAVGVDHIGVLVGRGRYVRELRPPQARRIFDAITRAHRVALSLSDDLEEVVKVGPRPCRTSCTWAPCPKPWAPRRWRR